MTNKKLLVLFFTLIICCYPSYSSESKYSNSLSRMEREWLYREYPEDNDEMRISRIEEKVFGTIHEKDLKSRYLQLQQAFNATKKIKRNNRKMSGIPTSIPISVNDLIN